VGIDLTPSVDATTFVASCYVAAPGKGSRSTIVTGLLTIVARLAFALAASFMHELPFGNRKCEVALRKRLIQSAKFVSEARGAIGENAVFGLGRFIAHCETLRLHASGVRGRIMLLILKIVRPKSVHAPKAPGSIIEQFARNRERKSVTTAKSVPQVMRPRRQTPARHRPCHAVEARGASG
jgi:hypothetical protein